MKKSILPKIDRKVSLVDVSELKHIENFSEKRVLWLKNKILSKGFWTVPIKIDDKYNLVMDGQHRMEVAKALKLKVVPCLIYSYDEVKVWSLRNNHKVDINIIVSKALSGDIYPYKTAKHSYPDGSDVKCEYSLEDLRRLSL